MLDFARPSPADGPDYERVFLDPQVQHWLRPPPLEPADAEQVAERLRADIAHWQEHGFGPWALRERAGGEFVGRGGLFCRELEGDPVVEIAWTIAPAFQGRGYATATADAAIAHARDLGIEEVVAFTVPDNAASRRVMEKAGMRFAGPVTNAGLPHVLFRICP